MQNENLPIEVIFSDFVTVKIKNSKDCRQKMRADDDNLQHLIEMFAQNVKVNLAKFRCLFVKAERVINK